MTRLHARTHSLLDELTRIDHGSALMRDKYSHKQTAEFRSYLEYSSHPVKRGFMKTSVHRTSYERWVLRRSPNSWVAEDIIPVLLYQLPANVYDHVVGLEKDNKIGVEGTKSMYRRLL